MNEILEQVKDRMCLRALEKIKIQLEKGNKENGDQAVAAQDDGTVTTLFQSEGSNHMPIRSCPFHLSHTCDWISGMEERFF